MRFCGMSTISPRRPCRRWGVVSGGISPMCPAISSSVLHIHFLFRRSTLLSLRPSNHPPPNPSSTVQPHPTPLHIPPHSTTSNPFPPPYYPTTNPPPHFLPKTTNPHTHATRPFQTHHRRVFERKQTKKLNGFFIGRS